MACIFIFVFLFKEIRTKRGYGDTSTSVRVLYDGVGIWLPIRTRYRLFDMAPGILPRAASAQEYLVETKSECRVYRAVPLPPLQLEGHDRLVGAAFQLLVSA